MKLLPAEVYRHHTAVLGKTGSGKTTTAKLMIDHVMAEGARVCVLDPIKSDWWGMTSSADGKRPGLPFQILGGPRGHVPLHETSGKAIGELVGSGRLPLSIIDMADFGAGGLQKFFNDFAPALLKSMRGVVYLVMEEAHEFAPKEKSSVSGENMATYYTKKLATAGRSKGIRLIVATQRVQALHNAVLGSCETMIAHRFTAPADQEPILKWLKANVDKGTLQEVAASLSSLKTGTAWVCSGEAGINKLVQFPRLTTFDNSATPADDAAAIEVKTAPVDTEKLRAIIGDAVKEAEANDPKLLRAKVRELEAKLAKAPAAGPDKAELSRLQAEAWADGKATGLFDAGTKAINAANLARSVIANATSLLTQVEAIIPTAGVAQRIEHRVPDPKVAGSIPAARPKPSDDRIRGKTFSAEAAAINGPQQRIIDALAWWASVGIHQPSRIQVAVIARYSPSGGAFQNPLGGLRTMGLVEYPSGGTVALTDDGRAAANYPQAPATVAEFHDRLQAILNGPQWRILSPIINAYPRSISRAEVAASAGYAPDGGAFQNPLGSLRTLGLIDYPSPGQVVALPVLFVEGK